jgi:hypothetical protein
MSNRTLNEAKHHLHTKGWAFDVPIAPAGTHRSIARGPNRLFITCLADTAEEAAQNCVDAVAHYESGEMKVMLFPKEVKVALDHCRSSYKKHVLVENLLLSPPTQNMAAAYKVLCDYVAGDIHNYMNVVRAALGDFYAEEILTPQEQVKRVLEKYSLLTSKTNAVVDAIHEIYNSPKEC